MGAESRRWPGWSNPVVTAFVRTHGTLRCGGILDQLLGRPGGPDGEISAAIWAAALEVVFGAVVAEGAFVSTDSRPGRSVRQIAIAAFAVRSKFQHLAYPFVEPRTWVATSRLRQLFYRHACAIALRFFSTCRWNQHNLCWNAGGALKSRQYRRLTAFARLPTLMCSAVRRMTPV